jgi:hypothetical protein
MDGSRAARAVWRRWRKFGAAVRPEQGAGTVPEQLADHGDPSYGHRSGSRELPRQGRQLGTGLADSVAAQPDLRIRRRPAGRDGDLVEVVGQDGALFRPDQDLGANG